MENQQEFHGNSTWKASWKSNKSVTGLTSLNLMTTPDYDWLYVAKRQGKSEFIKAFKRFDPANVQFTTNVDEAAEFTEGEWERVKGAIEFILAERLCLVSYADEPRKKQ